MKKILLVLTVSFVLLSCQKVEEKITQAVTETQNKVKQKTGEAIQESITEQVTKYVDARPASFDSVFTTPHPQLTQEMVGKKVAFPNGTPFYVFKYKVEDKDALLKALVAEPTADESRSEKEYQKIDGTTIIEKVTFFEKFLPKNTFDLSFLEDIKSDKNLQYYKVKRFPNASTIIYNPKTGMVYHFVEVKKP